MRLPAKTSESHLLTPAEVLEYFGYKGRAALRRLAARGLVERVNVGGDSPPGPTLALNFGALVLEAHQSKLGRGCYSSRMTLLGTTTMPSSVTWKRLASCLRSAPMW